MTHIKKSLVIYVPWTVGTVAIFMCAIVGYVQILELFR